MTKEEVDKLELRSRKSNESFELQQASFKGFVLPEESSSHPAAKSQTLGDKQREGETAATTSDRSVSVSVAEMETQFGAASPTIAHESVAMETEHLTITYSKPEGVSLGFTISGGRGSKTGEGESIEIEGGRKEGWRRE